MNAAADPEVKVVTLVSRLLELTAAGKLRWYRDVAGFSLKSAKRMGTTLALVRKPAIGPDAPIVELQSVMGATVTEVVMPTRWLNEQLTRLYGVVASSVSEDEKTDAANLWLAELAAYGTVEADGAAH